MKKALAAALVALALAGCSPGLDPKNPVPNPNPDHGAEPGVEGPPPALFECVSPFLILRFAIIDGTGYVSRTLHITIRSTDPDGNPVAIYDEKTKQTTFYEWDKDVQTDVYQAYNVCVEYPEPMRGAYWLDIRGVVAEARSGDSVELEVISEEGTIILPYGMDNGTDLNAKMFDIINRPGVTRGTMAVGCIVLIE